MRTTRGPQWPTVVLTLSVPGIVVVHLMALATWRAGYVYPYECDGTLGPLAYGVIGWLIAMRVPGNRLGPLMLAIPVVSAVQGLAGSRAGPVHEFGTTLRTVVDPDHVVDELRAVLVRTMQPNELAIWLRGPS